MGGASISGSDKKGQSSENVTPRNQSGIASDPAVDKGGWEQRLAAARAQREKVLASQGKPQKRAPVEAPSFLKKDSNGTLVLDPELEKPHPEVFGAGTSDNGPAGQPEDVDQANSGSWFGTSRRPNMLILAFIAFACFFGLGAGLALSLAAAINMGWLSVNVSSSETSDDLQSSAMQTVGPQSEMSVETDASLTGDASLPESSFADRNLVADLPADDDLAAPSGPDRVLVGLETSRQRLGSADVVEELVSPDTPEPAEFRYVFTDSLPLSEQPDKLPGKDDAGDRLPQLPETNNVAAMLVVDDLAPLSVDGIKLASLSLENSLPDLPPSPVLNEIEPGAMPQVSREPPRKLAVFDGMLDVTAMPGATPVSLVPDIPAIGNPPDKSQTASLSVLEGSEYAAFAMPGDSDEQLAPLSLADKLAEEGAPTDRVYLVTFAPQSISEADMAVQTALLSVTGFTSDAVNRVNYRVSSTHVRYYNRGDARVAGAIAAQLGAEARDFTNIKNPPPPGRIEVYLAGDSGANARSVSTQRRPTTNESQARAVQREAGEKARLVQSIVSRLQRGAHRGPAVP